jgi:hypothetical protein
MASSLSVIYLHGVCRPMVHTLQPFTTLQGGLMSKQNDNRRKLHVAQLAKQMNKQGDEISESSKEENPFVEQYRVIREDLMKLRDDLTHGYDMAKEAVDKKTILNELMKLRGNL